MKQKTSYIALIILFIITMLNIIVFDSVIIMYLSALAVLIYIVIDIYKTKRNRNKPLIAKKRQTNHINYKFPISKNNKS